MATYKSDNELNGRLGNLVFYTLNGTPTTRTKRRTLTKTEKKKMSPTTQRQNSRFGMSSTFSKMLRHGVPEKFAGNSNLHGTLLKRVKKEILERDSISARDAFKFRKEHLHHLNGVVLNDEFPKDILKKLTATTFEFKGENLEVKIPRLPLRKLAKQPEGFKVWVQIKILSMDFPYNISYVRLKESDSVDLDKNEKMAFSFDLPAAGDNEGVFAAIGFKSLKEGKMIEDVRMNGYVMVSVI